MADQHYEIEQAQQERIEELEAENKMMTSNATALVKIKPDEERAFIAIQSQAVEMLRFAELRVVANNEDIKLATEDLALIADARKAVEDLRKEYTIPLNDYLKAVNNTFKLLSDPLTQADKITRNKVLAYRNEQERKRQEAEAINREKMELARREAALHEGQITIDLSPVPVPEATPSNVRTETGDMGTAKVWRFEIIDFTLLPAEYKLPDLVKIGKVIRAGVAIPGVNSWQENTLRITTR